MLLSRKPQLSLPEPLRALEIPSFTNTSVVIRLPDIAGRTLSENHFDAVIVERIETLIHEIPYSLIRPVDIPNAPCAEDWLEYVQPYLGMNWLEAPWFFIEEYFYIRILEATGYFQPGPGFLRDPYAHQKQLGLESSRLAAKRLTELVEESFALPSNTRLEAFARLILADLWGNQNDLSLWPVSKNGKGHSGGFAADGASHWNAGPNPYLLSNDLPGLLTYLEKLGKNGLARMDIILDNAGYELVADLALADFALTSGLARQVVLHAKTYPVFVSDSLRKDIIDTIDWLCFSSHEPDRQMGIRLREALLRDSLILEHHPFWTSPLPWWDMAEDLRSSLASSSLIISKGDANYRRLLGDLHWPLELPFHSVVTYSDPAVLALRTCKSEIAVGIQPEKIPLEDHAWMYNGRYGLVQFAPPAHSNREYN
jgi:hypothetical protein